MKYQVENTRSGEVLGVYEADGPEGALEVMAIRAGYMSYAELEQVAPSAPGEISVKPYPATILFWWDYSPGDEGWFCEAFDSDGYTIMDSRYVGFPVNVDDFDKDEIDGLIAALKKSFPGCEIKKEGLR